MTASSSPRRARGPPDSYDAAASHQPVVVSRPPAPPHGQRRQRGRPAMDNVGIDRRKNQSHRIAPSIAQRRHTFVARFVARCAAWDVALRPRRLVTTAGCVNLTLMRPPPVKRQSSPLNASGCFFRALTASKVYLRSRALTSLLSLSASRAAAPDTYRGSIAAQAAMAADRSEDRCALDMLRCPHTVRSNTRAERRAFASRYQARGRSSTRV
jgi:hypothetical protein